MTGADFNAPRLFPVPNAPRWEERLPVSLAGFLFSFSMPVVFTMELSPRHRRIKFWNLQSLRLGPAKPRGCVMERRRSVPHTFEENIAAEKAKLEAQVAELNPVQSWTPSVGNQAVRYRCPT
jgi:hypothetical protein